MLALTDIFSSALLDAGLFAQPGRVDHFDRADGVAQQGGDGIAGEAGLRAGDHALLAEEAVQQRRFAGVGAADDGEFERLVGRHREPWSGSGRRSAISVMRSDRPSLCSAETARGSPRPRA